MANGFQYFQPKLTLDFDLTWCYTETCTIEGFDLNIDVQVQSEMR